MSILVNPWLVASFGFTPLDAWARPWTFGTYMFLHANVLHLAVNMLGLFVFGVPVEERMGGAPFLAYYLLCGLGGAFASLLLTQLTLVPRGGGASAGAGGPLRPLPAGRLAPPLPL